MTDRPGSINESVESISSSLLQRAKENDRDAWDRLVELYGRLVYWWCRRKGVPAEDVVDVGQDIFMAVSKGLESFDRSKPGQTFRGWLRSIARTKIADYFRRQAKNPAIVEHEVANVEGKSDDGTFGTPREELLILFQRIKGFVRNEFTDKDWLAFEKFTVGNCTAKEVADELGLSANQVYLAKSRIIRRIRIEFGDTLDFEGGRNE